MLACFLASDALQFSNSRPCPTHGLGSCQLHRLGVTHQTSLRSYRNGSEGFVLMTIEVAARQVEGITVVDVAGNLWPRTDKGGHMLSELVQDLAEKGSRQILLNLKGALGNTTTRVSENW
jgi:hypothetical protein